MGGGQVCSWTFVSKGRKMAEVCCTSIVYATDKKHTKVLPATGYLFQLLSNFI